jgi:hypothetical protein
MRAVYTPLLLVLGLWLRSSGGAWAQGQDTELLLRKLSLCGARFSLTESWGTLELTIANPNPTSRDARLCVFFASRPDVQYGRDVWVPGRSSLSTEMLIGPTTGSQGTSRTRDLQILLYDRTGGQDRLLLPLGERRVRDAWAAWWTAHGATAELSRLDAAERFLGYTLLVQVQQNTGIGRVLELGRDGKPRWQIDGLQYPVDAYVLGGSSVLITECNGQRVSERDLKGNILWQRQGFPSQPVNAQRLRNGSTFIATMTGVMEVDRQGKELYSHVVPGQNLAAAYKSHNGVITCLTQQGACIQLDATGKQVKSFPTGRAGGWTSGIDVSPGGRVLIAEPNQNLVVEFDPDGKTVWQANAPGVTTATRLSSGHTLVASVGLQKVFELDRAGKVVWEYKDGHGQFRARRR